VVVDDHVVMRRGLLDFFATVPTVEVVAEADCGTGAVNAARQTVPNAVLCDLRLPDMTGIEVCQQIRAELPDTRVILLTAFADAEAAIAAAVAGASSFVLKVRQPEELLAAIEAAVENECWFDRAVIRSLMDFIQRAASSGIAGAPLELSDRERAVISALQPPHGSLSELLSFREYKGPARHDRTTLL